MNEINYIIQNQNNTYVVNFIQENRQRAVVIDVVYVIMHLQTIRQCGTLLKKVKKSVDRL